MNNVSTRESLTGEYSQACRIVERLGVGLRGQSESEKSKRGQTGKRDERVERIIVESRDRAGRAIVLLTERLLYSIQNEAIV